jgi:hypothetical protein
LQNRHRNKYIAAVNFAKVYFMQTGER